MARKARTTKLDDEKVSSIVSMLVKDAEDYIDTTLAPERTLATRFYNGEALGDEEDGRSQIVMTEVRDVVQAMLPSLLRVFLSGESAVEYVPRRAETVKMAQQATDYANLVFYSRNNGASLLWDVFKDALVRKTGITRWYVDILTTITEETFSDIDDVALTALEDDEELELLETIELDVPAEIQQAYEAQIAQLTDPQTGQPLIDPTGQLAQLPPPPQPNFDAVFRRTVVKKKYIIESIPVDEFLIARNARNEDDAELIGVRKDILVSDLVAMGYNEDEVMQYGGPQSVMDQNLEAQARNPALQSRMQQDAHNLDPSMSRVRYYDILVKMDADGDGIAERHRICAIGENGKHVLSDTIVSDVDYAIFCPDPEPHTAIGNSIADQVMDLQDIKSHIVRATLDSLAQSIYPRTAVVEGAVNLDDVFNTEMGAIIRMRAPGMVQELPTTFVGQQALPVLAYLDDIRAQRTGISRATQGLDADVLQSTTKAAVTATVSAAQERLEMIARIFADGGMKRMFRGILRMLIQHQDKPEMVRLRGEWVNVDPKSWDADMDVSVNVGLGLGDRAEKLAVLNQVAANQKETLMTLGPDNPLTDMTKYRATLGKMLEMSGLKDTESYYKQVTPDDLKKFQDQMAQNKKPSPEEMLMQAQIEDIKAKIAIADKEIALKSREIQMKDDRERDKNEMTAFLQAMEIEAKYGTQVNVAQLKAIADKQRMAIQAAMTIADNEAQLASGAPAVSPI